MVMAIVGDEAKQSEEDKSEKTRVRKERTGRCYPIPASTWPSRWTCRPQMCCCSSHTHCNTTVAGTRCKCVRNGTHTMLDTHHTIKDTRNTTLCKLAQKQRTRQRMSSPNGQNNRGGTMGKAYVEYLRHGTWLVSDAVEIVDAAMQQQITVCHMEYIACKPTRGAHTGWR
jgi:hypothetical protein